MATSSAPLAVIMMGSKSDAETAKKVAAALGDFGIANEMRVASAHKTPESAISIAKGYEKESMAGRKIVIVAVVGMSNALSGMLAGTTSLPIVTLPNTENEHDIFSCLRMPSGISHMTILGAQNAALAAAKILATGDSKLGAKISEYQKGISEKVSAADKELFG
jgi:phosphoribosylaminoimidazole carboxylase PurE protein